MKRPLATFLFSVFGLLTGTATFILSTEMAFLRDTFFRECNIRFLSDVSSDHKHSVVIHNGSEHPIDVLITEQFAPKRSISDFSVAVSDPQLGLSFMHILRETASAPTNADGLNSVLAALDPHYNPPALFVVDDALSKARNQKTNLLGSATTTDQHVQRLMQCQGNAEAPGCKEEVALEKWERNVVNISSRAATSWRSETGLDWELDDKFYPEDTLVLSGSLPSGRTDYLSFVYDKTIVTTANVTLLLGNRSATRVSKPEDLDASTAWIAFRYYTKRSLIFGSFSLVLVLLVRFVTTQSAKHLSRREVANAALASPPSRSEPLWNELYIRTRPYLISDYRQACRIFTKTPNLAPYELFDHIRNRLILDYALNAYPFGDERQFEERLHGYIRELASLS